MVRRGHKGRVDANQEEVVKKLRQCGVTVQILSTVGQGCPDLLCGYRDVNVLLELKDENQPDRFQKLTLQEKAWAMKWNGQWKRVTNFTSAMDEIIRCARAK